MKIKEKAKINSNVCIQLFGPDGKLKEERYIHNTTTTAGKNGIAAQLASTPGLPAANWMEVGTGTGGTTKLNAYVTNSRTAVTSRTTTGAVCTYVCTFGPGVGIGALTEIGLFDVVTQDTINMWTYATFGVITKPAGDSLVVTWTITVG